jgi:multimeric flavodoxin WrbA
MASAPKILALVGSYRRSGTVDSVIDLLLEAAEEAGAETRKISLPAIDMQWCTNCRQCTQPVGAARGPCPITDDVGEILEAIDGADAVILGSPINFGTVTAAMKAFIERLACYAYWPWSQNAPRQRGKHKSKRAVIVVSSAAPALMARCMTGAAGLLKQAAGLLGARTAGVVFVGLAARQPEARIPERIRRKARRLGARLASGS